MTALEMVSSAVYFNVPQVVKQHGVRDIQPRSRCVKMEKKNVKDNILLKLELSL